MTLRHPEILLTGKKEIVPIREALGDVKMIHYMPHEKTRRAETLAKLLGSSSCPMTDPAMRIERDAASIASAMAMIHGGQWRIQIDHQLGYVVVKQC